MINKPKFFVSYPPGAGGQFMCLLIISLQTSITLIDKSSGHPQIPLINAGRDAGFQYTSGFLEHTSKEIDLEIESKWLLENFKFYNIDRNYYTIHCYLKNLEVILKTWPEAKIINIVPMEFDLDQMCYNFITKSMPRHNEWYMLPPMVLRIRERYNKLHWVDIDNIYNYCQNVRLCCYIMKFGRNRKIEQPYDQTCDSPRCYWLKFQDMFNKNLVNQLDQLIEFLDIEVSNENRESAIQMINEYSDAQKKIPWNLNLEDYD